MLQYQAIPYGYKSYNGKNWTNNQVDAYNAIRARIASLNQQDKHVSEQLLNRAHYVFSTNCLYYHCDRHGHIVSTPIKVDKNKYLLTNYLSSSDLIKDYIAR